MKILITGVHGFVGTNLVKALSREHTIYGLDIVSPIKEGISYTYSWDDLDKRDHSGAAPWQEEKPQKSTIVTQRQTREFAAASSCLSRPSPMPWKL